MSSDNFAQVRFSGAMTLPPAGGQSVRVRSPFGFEGSLMALHPSEGTTEEFDLFGRGTAVGTFSRTGTENDWNLDRLVFQFDAGDPTPEPATLLLVATGVGAALVGRRRSKR